MMNLKTNGFKVLGDLSYSRFVKVDPAEMRCKGELESCNGNNNAAYHAAAVPMLHGQAGTSSELEFRIRRNEAVVLVGKTPPPCDYFSYACYRYWRYEQGWGSDNVHKVFSRSHLPIPPTRRSPRPGSGLGVQAGRSWSTAWHWISSGRPF